MNEAVAHVNDVRRRDNRLVCWHAEAWMAPQELPSGRAGQATLSGREVLTATGCVPGMVLLPSSPLQLASGLPYRVSTHGRNSQSIMTEQPDGSLTSPSGWTTHARCLRPMARRTLLDVDRFRL